MCIDLLLFQKLLEFTLELTSLICVQPGYAEPNLLVKLGEVVEYSRSFFMF